VFGPPPLTLAAKPLAVLSSPDFQIVADNFKVSEKDTTHISTIYHVSMPFYMRLSGRPFGMHAWLLAWLPC
jgi:hypothetical protein